MRPRLPFPLLVFAFAGVLAGACAGTAPEAADVPAPASEPRATLAVALDLRRAQRCEEAFDLALYQDRGIELITWDEGSRCEDRNITVRYLPGRTTPEKIFRAVQATGAVVRRSSPIK